MAKVTIASLKDNIKQFQHNPASMQRIVLEALRDIHDGTIEVVDSATPFGFAIQASCVLASTAIDSYEVLNRRQYAVAAQTEDDLFLHMSDKDYLNRFAVPSTARFVFVLDYQELLQRLVEDSDLGVRKLVIPRNTEVTINDIVFTLLYPIEIRQLQHGGLQVLYNTNIATPIQTLNSNIIDYRLHTSDGVEWLSFEVVLTQVAIKSIYVDNDEVSNVRESIILEDHYYYLRAFMQNSNGKWDELYTTHTDLLYDYNKLTVVLKVKQNRVDLEIPQIYHTAGKVAGKLRFDLYETKAAINTDLSVYPVDAFVASFHNDLFDLASSIYTAPLRQFKTIGVYSTDITDGGADKQSLEQLRNTVVSNSVGAQILPITPSQIASSLERQGYELVRNVDHVTNRSFLATKALPKPINLDLVTPASAAIESLVIKEQELRANPSVKSNFRSVTITPNTLFESKSGVLGLVDPARVQALQSMRPELRVNQINTNSYYYTPFHYVLDFKLQEFLVRPYYLDKPTTLYKSFVADNDSTLLQVSVDEFELVRTATGYQLVVSVKSSANYKELSNTQVAAQLAYKPRGERDYAYLTGELVGVNEDDERVFVFDLSTNFHVNHRHELALTKFKMYGTDDLVVYSPLECEFEIYFTSSNRMPNTWKPDSIDLLLGKLYLPPHSCALAHEKLRVRFGWSLDNLWCRARSIISSDDYLRYTEDVYLTYEHDVYGTDSEGNRLKVKNGKVVYNLLHRKGDFVLDADGNKIIKHRIGDTVLDDNRQPVFSNVYGLYRQLDLLLLEGAYWFANSEIISEYKQELVDTLVNWIVDGLGGIEQNLLEQTDIFFYPKSTVGPIDVLLDNSVRSMLDSSQSFNVKLYVSSINYSNLALREELKRATVNTLQQALSKELVSVSELYRLLKDVYGEDVIAFELTGLGGDKPVQTISVLNSTKRLSLRKRLVIQGVDTLFVEEDVTCEFIKHDIKEVGT